MMMIIVVENAPPALRGRLSLWLSEIRAGTYVGSYGRRQRERLWADVKAMLGKGSAVIAWASATDSGFAFDSAGTDRRECVDLDGFNLVRFRPASKDTEAA